MLVVDVAVRHSDYGSAKEGAHGALLCPYTQPRIYLGRRHSSCYLLMTNEVLLHSESRNNFVLRRCSSRRCFGVVVVAKARGAWRHDGSSLSPRTKHILRSTRTDEYSRVSKQQPFLISALYAMRRMRDVASIWQLHVSRCPGPLEKRASTQNRTEHACLSR